MDAFAGLIEQSSLAVWIRESGVLYGYPLILFLHTLGLSTLAGLSSAINLRLLGVASSVPLASLERLFGVMWAGFALTATTGVLLFIADARKHSANPAFFVKLLCVAGAVTVLAVMGKRVFRGGQGGRLLAGVSLACWLGALSAGRLMAYIAEFVL